MTNELKPCPFCGGELKIDWSMGLQYWAYCPNDKCCFYETLIYDSVSELVEACNTRAERTCHIETKKFPLSSVPMCSECGRFWLDKDSDNYCPNCGAKVVSE